MRVHRPRPVAGLSGIAGDCAHSDHVGERPAHLAVLALGHRQRCSGAGVHGAALPPSPAAPAGAGQVVAVGTGHCRPGNGELFSTNPSRVVPVVTRDRYRRGRGKLVLGLCGRDRCSARGLYGVQPTVVGHPRCFCPVAIAATGIRGTHCNVIDRFRSGVSVGSGCYVGSDAVPRVAVGRLGSDVVAGGIADRVPGQIEVTVAGGYGEIGRRVWHGDRGNDGCEPWRLVRSGRARARAVHGAQMVTIFTSVRESGERVGCGGCTATRDSCPRTPSGQVAAGGVVVVDVVLVASDGRIGRV